MSTDYQALLLAAGEGRRLRPLTLRTPKCLVPVLGRPLLDYWLELLNRGPSPAHVWINTSYLADQVEAFLKGRSSLHSSLEITTVYEPELLGTAGTLVKVLSRLEKNADLLLAHADNLSWFNLSMFLAAHRGRPEETEITMMTFKTDNPQSCGIVELDARGVVQAFHEKVSEPPSNLANGAVYLISPEGLSQIQALGCLIDFSTEVIPAFLGRIYCWQNTIYHRDIGTPSSYNSAQQEFQEAANHYQIMFK